MVDSPVSVQWLRRSASEGPCDRAGGRHNADTDALISEDLRHLGGVELPAAGCQLAGSSIEALRHEDAAGFAFHLTKPKMLVEADGVAVVLIDPEVHTFDLAVTQLGE